MATIFSLQLCGLVRELGGEERVAERAALVATQMLGLAFCRYVVKLPAIVALSTTTIAERIGPTLERYIDGDADRSPSLDGG